MVSRVSEGSEAAKAANWCCDVKGEKGQRLLISDPIYRLKSFDLLTPVMSFIDSSHIFIGSSNFNY